MPERNGSGTTPKVNELASQLKLEPAVLHSLGLMDNGKLVAIPCRDHHGDVLTYQTRDMEDGSKRWKKDSTPYLFGVNDIDPTAPLLVVEGAVDWILCKSMHLNVIGLPSATFTVDTEWLDEFSEVSELIVLDEGGRAASSMLQTLSETEYADIISVANLDHRDIYDVWKAEDSDAMAVAATIHSAIKEAVPLSERLAPPPFEVIHDSGTMMSGEWQGIPVTVQLHDGGRVEVQANDGDRIVWRDIQSATDSGLRKMASSFDTKGLVSAESSSLPFLSDIVYGLVSRFGSVDGATNIFTKPEGELNRMLIDPFVVDDANNAVVGRTGATKSINAIANGLALASGQPIGVHRPTSENGEPVWYLDGEASKVDMWLIVSALARGHELDIKRLEQEGLFHLERISSPLLHSGEAMRRQAEREGYRLVIVDSVDTARGSDATNQSGAYYDVLRHIGPPSLSLDHIPMTLVNESFSKWRAVGSVRSTNRPRQTWAMKAPQTPKSSQVPVSYRLNYTNIGKAGRLFVATHSFEMRDGLPYSIHIGTPTEVERKMPAQFERFLIALHMNDGKATHAEVLRLTGLTTQQVSNAQGKARGKAFIKDTAKGAQYELTVTGLDHLTTEWGDEMPSPHTKEN